MHQVGGWSFGDQATPVDDPHPVGQMLGLVHEMGGQQNGDPFVFEVFDGLPGGAAPARVETGGRFVQEHQLRPADQGHGKGKALLLTAGETPVEGAGLVAEPHQGEQLVGGAGIVEEGGQQGEDLPGPGSRVCAALLQHDPDLGLEVMAVGGGVEAQYRDGSAGGAAQPFEDLHGGGLARPVGSQQGVGLPAGHLE